MSELRLLIEAEQFDHYGGWVADSQFEAEMGSAYLLAHGLGRPVDDATVTFEIPENGQYRVWARTKDWVPKYHPGRFELRIDSSCICTLGESGVPGWNWESAGKVSLEQGSHVLSLHDLTGFDGRCDAVYISASEEKPPEKTIGTN